LTGQTVNILATGQRLRRTLNYNTVVHILAVSENKKSQNFISVCLLEKKGLYFYKPFFEYGARGRNRTEVQNSFGAFMDERGTS
jgi:hypothetical protein